MKDIDISKAARKLIDAPYFLGPSEQGFDCLTIMRHFYNNLGIQLPPLPEGWTDKNYAERWKNGEGREELYEYLLSIGEEVQVNYMISGDLLIFDGEKWVFPGIYLGSGHFLAAYEKGVLCCPLKFFRKNIIEVRRLLS